MDEDCGWVLAPGGIAHKLKRCKPTAKAVCGAVNFRGGAFMRGQPKQARLCPACARELGIEIPAEPAKPESPRLATQLSLF